MPSATLSSRNGFGGRPEDRRGVVGVRQSRRARRRETGRRRPRRAAGAGRDQQRDEMHAEHDSLLVGLTADRHGMCPPGIVCRWRYPKIDRLARSWIVNALDTTGLPVATSARRRSSRRVVPRPLRAAGAGRRPHRPRPGPGRRDCRRRLPALAAASRRARRRRRGLALPHGGPRRPRRVAARSALGAGRARARAPGPAPRTPEDLHAEPRRAPAGARRARRAARGATRRCCCCGPRI